MTPKAEVTVYHGYQVVYVITICLVYTSRLNQPNLTWRMGNLSSNCI